jgi:hypothetical protein
MDERSAYECDVSGTAQTPEVRRCERGQILEPFVDLTNVFNERERHKFYLSKRIDR